MSGGGTEPVLSDIDPRLARRGFFVATALCEPAWRGMRRKTAEQQARYNELQKRKRAAERSARQGAAT